MTRTLTAALVSLGAMLSASPALAQEHRVLGQKGQFILSADRLFPLFAFSHVSEDRFLPPGGASRLTDTTNQTSISLLWGALNPIPIAGAGNGIGGLVINPFAVPRVGVDYTIIPNLTIGGDLAVYFTLGGNQDTETVNNNGASMTTSVGSPSFFVFGLAPRAGYVLPLTDLFTLWLRGGFSYYLESGKTTNGPTTTTSTVNQFALDLDPQVVFTLIPHVGFTAGLSLDIPLTGGHSQTTDNNNGNSISQSAGSSILFFGITAGLLAYF
ncbi:MAG: hypothetical protein JOZ69_12050 [Myxococcales bacterium]|nr:hypothetical protein [Myxococcales bacterium]